MPESLARPIIAPFIYGVAGENQRPFFPEVDHDPQHAYGMAGQSDDLDAGRDIQILLNEMRSFYGDVRRYGGIILELRGIEIDFGMVEKVEIPTMIPVQMRHDHIRNIFGFIARQSQLSLEKLLLVVVMREQIQAFRGINVVRTYAKVKKHLSLRLVDKDGVGGYLDPLD